MMRQRQAAVPWLRSAPVARGQQGGDGVPLLGEQFRHRRGIDTAVDEMQPAGAEGAIGSRVGG